MSFYIDECEAKLQDTVNNLSNRLTKFFFLRETATSTSKQFSV